MLETIQEGLLWICLTLDSFVYNLINFVYRIILVLARVNIFEDTTVLDNFVNRIYIIIGVVMLFLLAYSLLKSLVNPDDLLKGKNPPHKIVFNVLISVALIALTPSIFSFAMGFQNALLTQGTLNSIILGTENVSSSASDIEDGGFYMAAGVFQAFFHPISDENNYCQYFVTSNLSEGDCVEVMVRNDAYTYSEYWEIMREQRSFSMLSSLNEDILGKIDYTWLISTAAGIFVLFVLITYCVEIAIRSIKLAAFQLLAPIPILARLIPGEQGSKVFSNWVKACISTYLELFIRLAVLFFVILIITALQDNIGNILSTFEQGGGLIIGFLAWAFLIIGLVLFMKQLPGIVKDITGLDGGKFGKTFIKGIGMMAASVGGGATAAIRSIANDKDKPIRTRIKRGLTAGLSGSARGAWQGRKTEKLSDITKNAGAAATATLSSRANVEAAGGRLKYMAQMGKDKITDLKGWASGSFEAQQQLQNEVDTFMKDAKAVKSTSEGFVRDKKYLFSMYGKGEQGKVIHTSSGDVIINETTSLSAAEAIIESLKSSGNANDAKLADELNNDMQQRIKKIGQNIVAVSTNQMSSSDFDTKFMINSQIEKEAAPTIANTRSQYTIVQQKMERNPSLEAVVEFKNKYGDLKADNVSKLADELESQSANIAQNIRLEQDRRKNAKPPGKDK